MRLFAFLLLFTIVISSCKKEDVITDSSAKLEFSLDTVMFDTVFTSLGSTTKQLKIYNRNNRPVKISTVQLAGGNSSSYRLNLDGIPGKSFSDIEIPAKDSLFMFIEVTVDPNNSITPYLLMDSVVFVTNGNLQDVDLVAFGQNANFIIADREIITATSKIKYALLDTSLNATITWDSPLPYVVYGGYAVVDSSQTLIVNPGTRVYFANNSGLWVYRFGTLKVMGQKDNTVKFQGIRRESYYQDIAGQWDRIWINEGSVDNEINYAEIVNGFIGIQTECLLDTTPPKNLKLANTIIKNMSGFGILSRYFNITAYNCDLARFGQYGVALSQGGGYEFFDCTISNYWSDGQRSTPTLYLSDYALDQNQTAFQFPLYKANFYNCIIWGNNDEEMELDFQFGTNTHHFKNVLLKTQTSTSSPNFENMILNQTPSFSDYTEDDYQLQSNSPAINAGDNALLTFPELFTDIKGNNRQSSPDLGAYERQ